MPKAMPVSAPVVLKRRQNSASSSGGKLADAANTNAMLTSTVTLKPEPIAIVPRIAAAPTPIDAIRATLRSPSSLPRPRTLRQRSCAIAPALAITRPATTARIVANAAAENSARAIAPPVVPSPPPRNWASSGAARLPPLPTASVDPWPSSARAPKPMIVTIAVNVAMMPIV